MTKAEQCADGKGEVMDKYDRDCLAKLALVVEAGTSKRSSRAEDRNQHQRVQSIHAHNDTGLPSQEDFGRHQMTTPHPTPEERVEAALNDWRKDAGDLRSAILAMQAERRGVKP